LNIKKKTQRDYYQFLLVQEVIKLHSVCELGEAERGERESARYSSKKEKKRKEKEIKIADFVITLFHFGRQL
jgi:hypothetical protein